MEIGGRETGYPGSRNVDLKRSFKLGLHGLLTTCSKEEFCKAFPRFSQTEQERLHWLYIKKIQCLWRPRIRKYNACGGLIPHTNPLVIVSLHQNIEDEFEGLCQETKVGNVLDTVEELVEEQTLDPLYPDKTNFKDVEQVLSTLKKNEIQNLTTMLEKSEAQNKVLRSRLELLQKERHDAFGASSALEKMKTLLMLNHGTSNATDP